jgi:hypothetical protein
VKLLAPAAPFALSRSPRSSYPSVSVVAAIEPAASVAAETSRWSLS